MPEALPEDVSKKVLEVVKNAGEHGLC